MAKKKLTIDDVLVPKEEIPYEVPENWCWVKLGTVIKVSSGKNLTKSKMNEEGNIPVYGGNGFVGYHDDFNVEEAKIIIGRVGANCGNVHITDNKAWITDNAFIVSYDEKLFNKEYLYYLLSECDLGKYSNSSAQPVISGQKIYDVAIQLPPLDEQVRIVNRVESLFDKVDKASELVDEARDGFEKRRAAILERAFCGELTNSTPKYVKLKECGKFITDKKEPEKEDYYLGLEHFSSGYGISGGSSGEDVKSTKSKFKKGDILYGRLRPYLDKHDIVDKDGVCSTDILIFRCNEEISINRYINYFMGMNKFKSYAVENSKGINLPRVSAKVLKELVIPIFTINDQVNIINILDNVFGKEFEIDELTNIDENIELIKKSILVKAFRGEIGSNNLNEKSSIYLINEFTK